MDEVTDASSRVERTTTSAAGTARHVRTALAGTEPPTVEDPQFAGTEGAVVEVPPLSVVQPLVVAPLGDVKEESPSRKQEDTKVRNIHAAAYEQADGRRNPRAYEVQLMDAGPSTPAPEYNLNLFER